MKTRIGFVSNSSSSSFVVDLCDITEEQIERILNHDAEGERLGISYSKTDTWNVERTDTQVRGWTIMDNFSMRKFMRLIGVPEEAITWEERGWGWR